MDIMKQGLYPKYCVCINYRSDTNKMLSYRKQILSLIDRLSISTNDIFFQDNPVNISQNFKLALDHMSLLPDDQFPILFLEDDSKLIDDTIDMKIPPVEGDVDLIYLGGSLAGPPHMTQYNENYFKCMQLLCSHAILIPSKKSLEILYRAWNRSIELESVIDTAISEIMQDYNILTPINGPYFGQDDYTHLWCNFKWADVLWEVGYNTPSFSDNPYLKLN